MKVIIIVFFIFLTYSALPQDIVPREGLGEIEIGITYEDVIWVLGFDGSKMSKESAPEMLKAPLEELELDFDYVINFRYIMDLPITSVYIKDNLVIYFTISSYPEYNQFICQDMKTTVGLRFWDSLLKVKELYGDNPRALNSSSGDLTYYAFESSGICFGIDNDEVRTISIFDPDF